MESRPPQESPRRPTVGRKPNGTGGAPTPPWLWLLLILGFGLIFWQFAPKNEVAVDYSPWFLDQVNEDNIKNLSIQGNEGRGELRRKRDYKQPGTNLVVPVTKFVTHFTTEASIDRVEAILREKNEKGRSSSGPGSTPEPPQGATGLVWITLLLPTFLIVGLIYFMMRRARDQFDGGILGSFVKSPAKRHDKSKQRTTFDEVAGLENAKSELQEIVEFLKSPEKFQRLGGRIPKGVLLIGPPGTGKTLLARAVAGEAGVPFFSISRLASSSRCSSASAPAGSATCSRRPRRTAPASCSSTRSTPSAGSAGPGLGGGHDEREQTLNQILTEMDGFSPNESVIVLAATNRPDVLDPALLRPGRFDRHVTVDRPTRKGRHGHPQGPHAQHPAGRRRRPRQHRPRDRRHERRRPGQPRQRGGPAGHPRGQGQGRHAATSTPPATRSSWGPSARRSSPRRTSG